jgi:molybdenum cofactor cytidylyltransferase
MCATVTVAGVVLAAGAGSRFAGPSPELLAPLRGRPLVAWAIEHAARAGFDDVLVITGAVDLTDIPLPPGVRLVPNPRYAAGQSTSLVAALDAAQAGGHEAVVIGLADQPFVPAEAWRAVAAATDRPIAVATYDGRRRNPVRLAAEVWDEVRARVHGDEGMRQLWGEWPDRVAEVGCPGSPDDIDTTEELLRWNS